MSWEFGIDVGGTFTDCLIRSPQGELQAFKLLSSGTFKGRIAGIVSPVAVIDPARCADPAEFWVGYQFRCYDDAGQVLFATRVQQFDRVTGTLFLAQVLPIDLPETCAYELKSDEEAPLVAIRYMLGLRLHDPLPDVDVRLGTTRGTNALLTRRGARTAFVTTRGLRDILEIGTQDRPRLFDLNIRKPTPLYETVLEVDERISAQGEILRTPDWEAVREELTRLRTAGLQSLAICLLNAYVNPVHEQHIAQLAREVGWEEISISTDLASVIKLVSRGETTVLDAYLNPILREYMYRLRRLIPQGKLRLMTSAGGLVGAERFVGKDSILSGPAGGVIGYSRVAQAAGFSRAIGFDMGGTSTDVSRFDGRYELEFESRKAGVRVVSPMLAIETVAAGGGSLCQFDGVKLTVGPASAGADPGPACYGRGGPLTVTDLNVFLGKIPPSHFPFPLQLAPIELHLRRICDEISHSNTALHYTPQALAEGFLQVANANMVRPIRNISVAKGYDPRDYVLVTFGGAGGQHACAVSRALGIRQVLSHPWSGILSAYGMGQADVRRHRSQAVLRLYSPQVLQELEPLFTELAHAALSEVRAEGVPEATIQSPQYALELRYAGVDASLHVPRPEDSDYLRAFAHQHQRLYGYVHTGKPLEIVSARVEVIAETPRETPRNEAITPRFPAPSSTTQTRFDGEETATAVFLRPQLQAGDHLVGPAILCEPTSTLVIDPGWEAEVRAGGEIVLMDHAPQATHSATSGEELLLADPIRLEIFNNLFASIAEQMGTTLQRTSFSTNVKERLDFSCAIFSPRGELVVNAPHIPVHLGAMGETVRRILDDNPVMSPGDVFVTNDPYRGGSHLPDVTVVSPVHHPQTHELLFLTASRAHHAEIGGIVPGSMPPFSKNLAEEGVLIRQFKLVDGGESRETELRQLLESGPYPSRSVADNLADIAAEVAANQSGAQQLLALIERYSQPVVQAYMGHIQQAAEQKLRRALQAIPDGTYRWTDTFDDGTPVMVAITITGDAAVVDFAGTGPVRPGNLNANRAIVTAAVLYVFRCLIHEEIPLNHGVLVPVTITIPESLLSPPEHPDPAQCAAVVGGNVEVSQKVVDVLLGALGLAAASQGTMNNLTFGNERFGYYETICGGAGGTPQAAGASAVHTHMTNTRLTDPEVLERRYPVRLLEFSIRYGSGGAGQHQGGAGITRRLEFLDRLRVSVLSERREQGPFGLQGGSAGAVGQNLLQRAGTSFEQAQLLEGKVQLDVEPGDILTIQSPGGGGWGPAAQPS